MLKRIVTALVVVFVATLGTVIAQDRRAAAAAGGRFPKAPPRSRTRWPPVPRSSRRARQIYEKNCEKCHGKTGKGDGPDADPDMPPEDFSDPERIPRNPDGVMYYKIWNGRKNPKMPAFKSEGLSPDEVWHVIHYVKTFRK